MGTEKANKKGNSKKKCGHDEEMKVEMLSYAMKTEKMDDMPENSGFIQMTGKGETSTRIRNNENERTWCIEIRWMGRIKKEITNGGAC
jgi:hypothetical protein